MKRTSLLSALLTISLSAQVDPHLDPPKAVPLLERAIVPVDSGTFKLESPLEPRPLYTPTCSGMTDITRWLGSKAAFDTFETAMDDLGPNFAALG